MPWYYAVGSQQQGPVSDEEFEQLVRAGTIRPETRVWQAGMAEWQPYAAVMNPAKAPAPDAGPGGEDSEVCAVSGKRYPKRVMIQYEGKWISAEHRDEFFQRLREGVAQPGMFKYGGFWIRFVAKIIDGIAVNIVQIPLNMTVAYLVLGDWNYFGNAPARAGLRKALTYNGIVIPIGMAIGLAYVWFFMSRYDATPGKMAFGLKVLRPDGAKLSTGRIVGRYFAEIISSMTLAIGFIIAAFDEQKRSLHDRIADTRVIKVK